MGTSTSAGILGNYDSVDSSGNPNNNGTKPNDDSGPYIDITKSTIAYINSQVVDGNHEGELIIYVPQGAEIFFQFLKSANIGSVDVKIEAYVYDIDAKEYKYVLYNEAIGGYVHTDNYYNLVEYKQ